MEDSGGTCENCGKPTENLIYCDFCSKMTDKAMARKLQNGEAIDVSGFKRDVLDDYILPDFVENVDYCDSKSETWIHSIGQHVKTKEIHAAISTKFYQNADYRCLWLR